MKRLIPHSSTRFSRIQGFLLIFSQLTQPCYAQDQDYYVVRPGDTFSQIVWNLTGSPLYGKNHYLEKYSSLNAGIDVHRIYPGQKIKILKPERTLAQEPEAGNLSAEAFDQNAGSKSGFPYSRFLVQPLAYFSVIQGTDRLSNTHAELVSRLNFGIHADWSQAWSERFKTRLFFDLKKEDYYTSDNATLENTSIAMGAMGVGASYSLSPRIEIHGGLGYSQEIFYRAKTLGTLVLEPVPIPKLDAGLTLKVLSIAQYDLKAEVDGIYIGAASSGVYRIQSGKGYRAALGLNESMGLDRSFGCEIFYAHLSMDTNLVDQSRQEIGLGCGLRFGGGEK